MVHHGSILVFPDRTEPWGAAEASAVTFESLASVVEYGGVQILLLGLGRRMTGLPVALRAALRSNGIILEAMDTGAACRTYNVLVGEERRVAAALLPLQ